MWGAAAVIAVGAAIAAFEMPALIKRRSWRVWTAFFTLLIAGMAILMCITLGVTIPSPLEPLRLIFEPTGRAIRGE